MDAALNDILKSALDFHKQGKFDKAEELYCRILNAAPFERNALFLLADLSLRIERNGLATVLLTQLLQNHPKDPEAWCNMGVALRKENRYDQAQQAWERAVALKGDSVEVCSNMAGLYADRAKPNEALHWIERALKCDPENIEAQWLKALALLTLKRWDEGWKMYEWRTKLETWDSRKTVDCPRWDGSEVKSLYIHGEQGVGDEVMFASCLPFVKTGHVTVEVNPKVAPLIQQSFPDFDVVTETGGEYDAKIPIGSLPALFGFNREPYLKPSQERVDYYRRELEKLGPGPYVALTWIGGTKQTRIFDRSLNLKSLAAIQADYTCVCAQYVNGNPYTELERQEAGLAKIDDASCGENLHDQAALFKAVDAVVTVQQTAVHVAGGVGAKTFALIGARPHWRYGIEGDSLPFYGSVTLYRQQTTWEEAISRLKTDLDAYLRSVPRAEQEAA